MLLLVNLLAVDTYFCCIVLLRFNIFLPAVTFNCIFSADYVMAISGVEAISVPKPLEIPGLFSMSKQFCSETSGNTQAISGVEALFVPKLAEIPVLFRVSKQN